MIREKKGKSRRCLLTVARNTWEDSGSGGGDDGKVPGSNFCICLPSTRGAASSLRMTKIAFTLRAAYVHSYAMPVFMYHLCGVPAGKSCAFGRQKRHHVLSRMARAMFLFALTKT